MTQRVEAHSHRGHYTEPDIYIAAWSQPLAPKTYITHNATSWHFFIRPSSKVFIQSLSPVGDNPDESHMHHFVTIVVVFLKSLNICAIFWCCWLQQSLGAAVKSVHSSLPKDARHFLEHTKNTFATYFLKNSDLPETDSKSSRHKVEKQHTVDVLL